VSAVTERSETTVELGIPGISDATQVGRGGFGTVYRARQEKIGRTVAVKILGVSTLGADEQHRFERECQALGSVSGHPNIVSILDSGTSSEQRPYLIMDYLPGGTLAEGLDREGPTSWQVAADLGVKLAGALAAAHAAGVLHRDVKPDNVLMSAYGEPQLADFGIARFSDASHSRTGQVTATLAHAAPEVIDGRAATEASDVYSLASTLYELLSGHPPFVRPTDQTLHPLLARVVSEDPPDLRASGQPDAICDAIDAALAKDPATRTPSAVALAESLQHAQRTLNAPVTPLVVPPVTVTRATASPVADAPRDEQPTELRVRRRREPAAEPAAVTGGWRRRWPLLAAGVSSAVLVLLVGAYAVSRDGRHAARSVAASRVTTTPATATARTTPSTTTSGAPVSSTTAPTRGKQGTHSSPGNSHESVSPRPTLGQGSTASNSSASSSRPTGVSSSDARSSSPPASTRTHADGSHARRKRKPKHKSSQTPGTSPTATPQPPAATTTPAPAPAKPAPAPAKPAPSKPTPAPAKPSSTQAASAPPGYGGPMSTCPGTLRPVVPLASASGAKLSSTLNIWYSGSNSGTFCAKTYDNLPGSHHMEVVIRRADWQTPWYDSGMFTTYAGGVAVYGAATKCVSVFGRVTVNGVNYEARSTLKGPNATC